MKKLILFVIVLGLLVGGYFYARAHARLNIDFLGGQLAQSTRGDLVVPITASGTIQPASVRKLKSKASGEITSIPYNLGARVREGDLVVKLQDDDELRNRQRALADQHRAEIALETAKINLKQRQTTAVDLAKAKLADAEAQLYAADSHYNFMIPQTQPSEGKPPISTQQEWDTAVSTKMRAQAAVDAAKADLGQTDTAIRLAEEDVKNAGETLTTAKTATAEAEQRLRETSIFSPINGMVLARPMHVGEIAQGGTMTLMGGSELIHIADISAIYAVVNVDEADIGQVHKLAPSWARPGVTTQPADGSTTRPATQPAKRLGDMDEAGPESPPARDADDGSATSQPAEGDEQGSLVKVKVESFPDEDFFGVITQISPQSEVVAAVATFKVWIRITSDNVDKLVGLLNTQAEAHFTVESVRDAVLVPYDAVQKDPNSDQYGVYVPKPKPGAVLPEAVFVPCKFGYDNGLNVEVREGIQAGQQVYVKLPPKRDENK